MSRYQTTLTYTEEAIMAIEFECPDKDDPMEVLKNNLPPLNNLTIGEIKLVAASDGTTLN